MEIETSNALVEFVHLSDEDTVGAVGSSCCTCSCCCSAVSSTSIEE